MKKAETKILLIPWVIGFIAAAVILGIAAGFMWLTGMFDALDDDPGTELLAASFVVVGSLLSAVVALIGIVVKFSIDDRNSQIAAQEQQSNHIDVAIRAVGLLSENATPHQMGGALLALVTLGEMQLAVALLASLWPKKFVSDTVAEEILEGCLSSGSEDLVISAANVLSANAHRIGLGGNVSMWPIPDLGWRTDLPSLCRIPLINAVCEWLATVLERDPNHIPIPMVVLYEVLDDPLVREIAEFCLLPLHGSFPSDWAGGTATHLVSMEDISKKIPEITSTRNRKTIGYRDRIVAALEKQTKPLEDNVSVVDSRNE